MAYQIIGLMLLFGTWWYFGATPNYVLPPIHNVILELYDLATIGPLMSDVGATVYRVSGGICLAVMGAVAISALHLTIPPAAEILQGPIELLRPIPPIAWVPVAILLFGVGDQSAMMIVALGAFFPLWHTLKQGFSEVWRQHLLAARSLGATPYQCFIKVTYPSILPYFLKGFRLAVGFGWFCVVAAEMVGASNGLGHGIQLYSLNIELERTYSYLIVTALLGFCFHAALQALDTKLCGWHTNYRQGT